MAQMSLLIINGWLYLMWNINFEGVPYWGGKKIKIVQWQWYVKVVAGQKDNGEDWKVTQLQYMDTPNLELLEYLCPRLKDFVTHNFVAKWQDKVPQNTS